MKKNYLALGALVLAIAFSSFTKKTTDFYFVYKGSGSETAIGNFFDPEETQPNRADGSGKLNWVRVTDTNDDIVDATEFSSAINALDVTSGSQLDNESDAAAIDVKNP